MGTREVTVTFLRAHLAELLDEVARTGAEVVVTRRARPVARLRPATARPGDIFGLHAGGVSMRDDLVAPTGARWEADG